MELTPKLAAAIVKAQQEIEPAPTSADNPYFKSKYTPLPEVWKTIKPALGKCGLAVIQTFEPVNMDQQGNVVNIRTTLIHESGESVTGVLTMPLDKATPQAVGSAITYGRRYSLAAMLGVVSEMDDDAEGAMDRKNNPPKASDTPVNDDLEGLI
jgi:hypothetical protein